MMDNTLLHNQNVIILLFSSIGAVLSLTVALILAIDILLHWDFDKTDKRQYRLEKKSWLIATIVGFVAGVKVIELPYFVFTIDSLSRIVPGAMCGAGVISYNDYGMKLLFVKIVEVGLIAFWLLLNRYDIKALYLWVKPKMVLLVLIFFISLLQLWLLYHFFEAIDIHKVVHCCTTLYGLLEGMNPLPFGLDTKWLLILFFLLYALIVSSYLGEQEWIFALAVLLFAQIAYYSVIYIFGPYIYEQPNHNCPFCMMQKEYHYVGYAVWGLYFSGLFFGLWSIFAQKILKVKSQIYKKWSVTLLGLFVALVVGYVVSYYYEHHTFLQEVKSSGMMMEM